MKENKGIKKTMERKQKPRRKYAGKLY